MIYQTGVSFKDFSIKSLGRAINDISNNITKLKKLKKKDFVPLITCNRAEVYSSKPIRFDGYKTRKGKDAAKHLFRVACGIDSMVIGENEISAQVRDALQKAKINNKLKNEELEFFFIRALRLAKKARAETKINFGKTSIPSIAVDFAVNKFHPKKVLVIGSGMLAGKISKALSTKGIDEIILSNRHYKRALKLAKKVNAKAARLDNLKKLLTRVNVVFSTTSCPIPVIYKKDIPKDKLTIIDLAVPYDVDKEVDKLPNVEVIRLEHFKKIANKNLKQKRAEIKKVEKMIDNELQRIF